MKALKIILAVLGGSIVLVIVAAIIFIKTFDPNSLKDDLQAFVLERTGRTLAIEDSIELSLFPWFAVETGGVSLSDDPAFGARDLIAADRLSARIRVWPLLKRRIEIGRVVFDGININLGLDAEGRGNWASLFEYGNATRVNTDDADAAPEPKRRFEQLAVESIEFRNTRILWHDPAGEVTYLIRDLNFRTGTIRNDEPVALSLELALLDVASQASVEIELESVGQLLPDPRLTNITAQLRVLDAREDERMRADLGIDAITLSDNVLQTAPLTLTAALTRPPIGPESLQLQVRMAALEIDTVAQTATVNGLSTAAGPLSANWNLQGTALFSAPRISGDVTLRGESLAGALATLGVEQPADLGTAAREPVTGSSRFALQLEPREMALSGLTLNALGLQATGSATMTADGALTGRIVVPNFSMTGQALETLQALAPEGVNLAGVGSASAGSEFTVSADRDRIALSDFAVTLGAARLGGELALSGPADTRVATGKLTLTGLDNALLTALATGLLPESLLTAELGQFSLETDFRHGFATQLTDLDPMRLTAYGLSGEGQLTMRQSGDQLALSGQARLAEFSPRALLGRFDQPVPASSDPTVLRSARLAATFETTGNDGRFRDIAIDLDDSRITGEFSVEDFANPSYHFVLRADQIDVDRYLPPAGSAAANDAGNAEPERTLGEIELANEALTATVVQGSATVGNLKIGGMQYEQFTANLTVGGGQGSLSDVRTRLYGGEFSGGASIDATGESPAIHLTGNAANVAVEPLLTAMLGDSNISGTGNISLDLTGTGTTIGDAMRTAAGTMALTLNNGIFEGVNVGRDLCIALNIKTGLQQPEPAPNSTAFTQIRGTATVRDGIASSSDLAVATSYLRMDGRANMQLIDQRISSKFIARMTGPVNLQGCERLNRRIDNSIPIGITLDGKSPDFDIGFDIAELLKDMLEREAQDQFQNSVRERVLDRLLN